jgi:hypothetical protein
MRVRRKIKRKVALSWWVDLYFENVTNRNCGTADLAMNLTQAILERHPKLDQAKVLEMVTAIRETALEDS